MSDFGLLAVVGTGPYINGWKLLPALLILIGWARLMTWADKDAEAAHLPRSGLMGGMLGGLVVGFAAFFLIPNFWAALAALIVLFAAEIGIYLSIRSKKVGLKDLKEEINGLFKGKGGAKKEAKVVAGAIQFVGKKGELLSAPAEDDPSVGAFLTAQDIFTTPLKKDADQIELVNAEGGIASRFLVDGVAYAGTTLDKASASSAIEYIKGLAGMDVNDRRKPQSGTMKIALDGKKRELKINTRGTSAGETMSVLVESKSRYNQTLESAGFTPDQIKKIKEAVTDNTGVGLICAPARQGLTTTSYAVVRAHDAFLQHIQTIERDAALDLEGITQNKLAPAATGQEEYKQVGWVTSQQPDVVFISEIQDPKSAVDLIRYSGEGHRVYVGMRSQGSLEAIMDWRKIVGDDSAAAQSLQIVIASRIVRKLCPACKVGYTPDPTTLRKLNMDPTKVGQLFQARSQPMRDDKGNIVPCMFCNELRFKGRVGVFEVFVVDDEVKQVISAGGSINQLKALFRKQRSRLLLEQAMLLVEKGETSIQEVLRVLKPPEPPQMGRPKTAPVPAT